MEINNTNMIEQAIEFANIYTWDYDINKHCIYNANSIASWVMPECLNNVPESLINANVFDPDDTEYILNSYEEINHGKIDNVHECWITYANNQRKYIKVKYLFEYDPNNNPTVGHAFAIDLTEQKNAETVFKHRTKTLLNINQNSLITFTVNISKNICNSISYNYPSLRKNLSSNTFDDIKKIITDLISDKFEKAEFLKIFDTETLLKVVETGVTEVHLEHHLKLGHNNEQWVLTRLDFLINPITADIEALGHISNIHYQKIINGLINGTINREFDYIALYYVKTDNYIIIDKYEQLGKEILHDFLSSMKEELRKSIQDNEEYERVASEFNKEALIYNINSHGEYVVRYNTSTNINRNHHKIISFSFLNSKKDIITVSCRDTTNIYIEDLKQKNKLIEAIQSAEKANKAKSEFLSLVSHDIRTPLNGIMGMLQLASEENDISKVKDYISKASLSSGFLLGLINDILDLSKMESGKMELTPTFYMYSEFISYINSVIRPLCKKKKQRFAIHSKNIVPYIYVDSLRLNQIMFNLLSNASKYTHDGGSIQLKIAYEKIDSNMVSCKFVVKDDGIGMSDDFKHHMFESFAQEKRMNLSVNEGSGLGLTITKNLIDLMGGTIFVRSEINKGTEIEVNIITSYCEQVDNTNIDLNKNKTEIDLTGKTFLLCEDNEINQEIMVEIMKSIGANVDIAADGVIGLAKYKEKKAGYYSGIFMDVRMPNMDGLQTSKEIRKCKKKDSSSIPIIAMTANAMSKDKMECIEAGMNAFVAKPINVKQLYKTINQVIN